jgi:hypothetical protein
MTTTIPAIKQVKINTDTAANVLKYLADRLIL